MPEYDIEIIETLRKVVTVDAKSLDDALTIAEVNWNNSEYLLDGQHFLRLDINPIEKIKNRKHER